MKDASLISVIVTSDADSDCQKLKKPLQKGVMTSLPRTPPYKGRGYGRSFFADFLLMLASTSIILVNVAKFLPLSQQFASSGTLQGADSKFASTFGLTKVNASEQPPQSPAAAIQPNYPATHLRNSVDSSFFAPHPSLPLTRGHDSGICIAITSSPRQRLPGGQDNQAWAYVEQLMKMLDGRRAKAPFLERDMWAVVHSSGCDVELPIDTADAEGKWQYLQDLMTKSLNSSQAYVEEIIDALEVQEARQGLAEQHMAAVSEVAEKLELEAYVIPAHPQACKLIQDAARLLRTVPPQLVAQDGWERWLWRSKLAIDFVYVMNQCLATRPKYILLLQDDTKPAHLWDIGIERFIARDLKEKQPWTMLSLYYPETYRWGIQHASEYKLPCCAQALLFDASKVRPLLEHFEAAFMERPMDHNIRKYLEDSSSHAYVHVPSLFQHEGRVRTNNLKVKYHFDRRFREWGVRNPYDDTVAGCETEAAAQLQDHPPGYELEVANAKAAAIAQQAGKLLEAQAAAAARALGGANADEAAQAAAALQDALAAASDPSSSSSSAVPAAGHADPQGLSAASSSVMPKLSSEEYPHVMPLVGGHIPTEGEGGVVAPAETFVARVVVPSEMGTNAQ